MKEQRSGNLPNSRYREIEAVNPDAEPPCASTKTAIVVFGSNAGQTLSICTDTHCAVHDPNRVKRQLTPVPEDFERQGVVEDNEEEQHEAQHTANKEEQEQRDEERRQRFEQEQQEQEAEQERRAEILRKRHATFERIVAGAPAVLTAAQLRLLLRAIVDLDPFTFLDDLAKELADENDSRGAEEVVLGAIDTTPDDRVSGFAVQLALTGHRGIPRDSEFDYIAEAEGMFLVATPRKEKTRTRKKQPTPIRPAKARKTATPKKRLAA